MLSCLPCVATSCQCHQYNPSHHHYHKFIQHCPRAHTYTHTTTHSQTHRRIEYHELNISDTILGSGSGGETRLAHMEGEGRVVVKYLHKSAKGKEVCRAVQVNVAPKGDVLCLLAHCCVSLQLKLFHHEVAVHANLSRHPNVVTLMGK